jgi:hypothetical protein
VASYASEVERGPITFQNCNLVLVSNNADSSLEKVAKNPYYYIKRRKLQHFKDSNLKKKTSELNLQSVNLQKCCNHTGYQTFGWKDTMILQYRLHLSSFEY